MRSVRFWPTPAYCDAVRILLPSSSLDISAKTPSPLSFDIGDDGRKRGGADVSSRAEIDGTRTHCGQSGRSKADFIKS
jgi:hypothetical protein